MWYGQYEEFAMSFAGGRLSAREVQSRWAKWKSERDEDPEADTLIWDLRGPAEAPVRFWVEVEQSITYRDAYGTEHSIEAKEKPLTGKAITDEALNRMQTQLRQNHERGLTKDPPDNVDF
eukprot:2935668-Alexandrium_andersonii.AAC.1